MFIYLVRHGQTQANVDEVCTGYTETDLTEVGIKQAQATGNILEGITFDAIFSSNTSRAQATAKYIIKSDQEIIIEPLIQERNYGYFDGKPGSLMKQQREELDMSFGQFLEHHPSIETNTQIIERFEQFVGKHIIDKPYERILVVSHGSFLRVSMSSVVKTPRVEINHLHPLHNAGISIIEYTPPHGFRLVTYNQHLHLLNLK